MIRDILCMAAVGIGSAMVGWAVGAGHQCDICTEEGGRPKYPNLYLWEKPTCADCKLKAEVEAIGEDADDSDILGPAEYAEVYGKYKEAVSEYQKSFNEPEERPMEIVETNNDDIYVISYNEWCANDGELSQTTLVYYEGDQVICDMADDTIQEIDEVIGEDALELFGMMSNDPDVVYIRNTRRQAEYEVVREWCSYREAVLGLSEEAEETSDAKVQEALAYFDAKTIDQIDPSALAKYHEDREDE